MLVFGIVVVEIRRSFILLIFWGKIVNVLFLFQTININNNHIINDIQVSVCGALVNWKLSRIEKKILSFFKTHERFIAVYYS